MKMGLQNYAVIIPVENSCVRCNNNKISNYKSVTLHKITEFYTKWFRVCHIIISTFQSTTIFKSTIKENDSNYTFAVKNFICLSAVVHELSS
jgi:hypothetical protein